MSKYILIDTRCDGGYTRDDYKEFLSINGYTKREINQRVKSDSFYDYVRDMLEEDFSNILDEIKYAGQNDMPVIVSGSIYRWDRPNCGRNIETSVEDAIKWCITDAWDYCIEYIAGELVVHSYDHDGTSTFFIRPLSAKGQRKYDHAYDDYLFLASLKKWDTKKFPKIF